MVTGKEVNTYTSWELALQCPHSRSNHGTYNLRLLFIKREMCSLIVHFVFFPLAVLLNVQAYRLCWAVTMF